MSKDYNKTVQLLLEILPYAVKDRRVALKGGTAINLFHRDFPRLSVDIDICYLPLESRDQTYKNLHEILANIKSELESKLKLKVISNHPLDGKREAKLIASNKSVEVKIEPNYTLRSSLFDPEIKSLSPLAQKEFGIEVDVLCLGLADTFGGKICAALDRQHPRDLFDVKNLLENEGITRDVMDSFILYLVSHNRPIDELLNPNLKNIESEYNNEFLTMAKVDTPLDELLNTRANLIKKIREKLSANDKEFLISFVSNDPDWSKVRNEKIKDFPSVRWKLINQQRMKEDKVKTYVQKVNETIMG